MTLADAIVDYLRRQWRWRREPVIAVAVGAPPGEVRATLEQLWAAGRVAHVADGRCATCLRWGVVHVAPLIDEPPTARPTPPGRPQWP